MDRPPIDRGYRTRGVVRHRTPSDRDLFIRVFPVGYSLKTPDYPVIANVPSSARVGRRDVSPEVPAGVGDGPIRRPLRLDWPMLQVELRPGGPSGRSLQPRGFSRSRVRPNPGADAAVTPKAASGRSALPSPNGRGPPQPLSRRGPAAGPSHRCHGAHLIEEDRPSRAGPGHLLAEDPPLRLDLYNQGEFRRLRILQTEFLPTLPRSMWIITAFGTVRRTAYLWS